MRRGGGGATRRTMACGAAAGARIGGTWRAARRRGRETAAHGCGAVAGRRRRGSWRAAGRRGRETAAHGVRRGGGGGTRGGMTCGGGSRRCYHHRSRTRVHRRMDSACQTQPCSVRGCVMRANVDFLPPCCPDADRIERVWQDLHASVTCNHRGKTMKALLSNVREHFEGYVWRPALSRSTRRELARATTRWNRARQQADLRNTPHRSCTTPLAYARGSGPLPRGRGSKPFDLPQGVTTL